MRVLLATDGSNGAQAAAKMLAGLPFESSSEIHVLAVCDAATQSRVTDIHASAREALSHSSAALRCSSRGGNPADVILTVAEETGAELIVVGASGHTAIARFFIGSVAERVARHSNIPVLVVRPPAREIKTVILAVDNSPDSDIAVRWMRSLPLPQGAEVHVVTFIPNLESIMRARFALLPPLSEHLETLDQKERHAAETRTQEARNLLEASGKRAVTELSSGDAIFGLARLGTELGADLIVLGSRGETPLERFLLGSVSDSTLRHATCSVAIVHHPRARTPQLEPVPA
jgi:nucleotide-binding universal stress UspA family protein